jgi:phosphatidate phosphatase PAH1
VKQILENYQDVEEMIDMEGFDSGSAKITIKPLKDKENTPYRFFIDSGSTIKKDDLQENETLTSMIDLILEVPGAAEQIAQTGEVRFGDQVFSFGEMLKKWVITSGIEDSEKIVRTEEAQDTEGQMPQDQMMQEQGVTPQDVSGMMPDVPMQEQNPYDALTPEDRELVASFMDEGQPQQ